MPSLPRGLFRRARGGPTRFRIQDHARDAIAEFSCDSGQADRDNVQLRGVCGLWEASSHGPIAIQHYNLKVSLFLQDVDSNVLLVSGKRKVDARLSYSKVPNRYLLEEFR